MPSSSRLFLMRTPWNFPLTQSPMKIIQRSVKIFAILRMFCTTIHLRTIVNQAANDDKSPVIHCKNVSCDSFKDQMHIFFSICVVKYHTSLCFHVFWKCSNIPNIKCLSLPSNPSHAMPQFSLCLPSPI